MKLNANLPDDELYASVLAACDEALATGGEASELSSADLPPNLQPRLERDLACLQLLERLWPRAPEQATSTPGAELTWIDSVSTAPPPRRLGRFEIRRELGRGGYGVVFLACDPALGREVALKIPRPDALVTRELRQRFHHEAQAAARLDHPNLVTVLEAGEIGPVCYIASAYCPGVTLAEWLQARTLPVPCRDAAELVAMLADAVQHAHSRGVLHRDLKPGNVLLSVVRSPSPVAEEGASKSEANRYGLPTTDYGLPKITDFGLAKLQGGEASQTQSGTVLGTASYMAPEQAEGRVKDITTAVDVYGLGAILYELLTGRPPFRGESALGTLEQVRRQPPVSPRRLRAGVPRDLETICLKCLRKEPQRRYPSAQMLAEDLRRFLVGEPIQARPIGGWERIARWARRRPAAAALVLVSSLAIAGLIFGVFWHNRQLADALTTAQSERERAEDNFDRACEAVDKMLAEVGQEHLAHVPHMEAARRKLLHLAAAFYEDFLLQKPDDPRVRWQAVRARARVGYVHQCFGEIHDAERHYRQALNGFAELEQAFSAEARFKEDLALTHQNLSMILQQTGRLAEAESSLRSAMRSMADVPVDRRTSAWQRRTGECHAALASLLAETGRLPEGEQAFALAVATLEKLATNEPANLRHRQELAKTLRAYTAALIHAGRFDAAAGPGRRALAVSERLADDQPTNPVFQAGLARDLHIFAELERLKDALPQAEEAQRRSLAIYEKLQTDFPYTAHFQEGSAEACTNLGVILGNQRQLDLAEQMHRRAVALWQKLVAADSGQPYRQSSLGACLNNLGAVLLQRNQLSEARSSFESAAIHQRNALAAHPRHPRYRLFLRNHYHGLAETLIRLGDHAEASRTTEALTQVYPTQPNERFAAAGFLARCGTLAQQDQRLTADEREKLAQGYHDLALAVLRAAVENGFRDVQLLEQDPALAAIRSRADYQRLLAEVRSAKQ